MALKRLKPQEEAEIRILIRHALIDMEYGGGGTYTIDPSGRQKADTASMKKAKRGIATIAKIIEELKRSY